MIDEIANLPDVSFIDDMQLEDVQEMLVTSYKQKYEQETGEPCDLGRADPITLMLFAMAVEIYQALLYVDRAGKQDLLKYAYGDYLDNLAALKGISREPAKAATVTVRFTLSGLRPSAVGIPEESIVTNGENIYFRTTKYAEIPPGEQSVDVVCECMTTGTEGNGLLIGEINILTNPVPYIATVANIDMSAGGTDTESDEALAGRVYLAPSSYSTAGPEDAYVYWTKEFNSGITDVYVDSDDPGLVTIEFIMQDGELPGESLIRGLQDYLENENIRPLTDHVVVSAPETESYDIELKYMINASDKGKAATIQAAVAEAVQGYIIWQRSSIGRDINPSELIKRCIMAGAKRVEVTQPVFRRIPKDKVAALGRQAVTYGGIEDD